MQKVPGFEKPGTISGRSGEIRTRGLLNPIGRECLPAGARTLIRVFCRVYEHLNVETVILRCNLFTLRHEIVYPKLIILIILFYVSEVNRESTK